jgi:hypothetical protein
VAKFSVIYDACVLYPAPLRDLLMQLAVTDLFKARWTDQILKRDGVCNPVTHVLKAIEAFKRFGRVTNPDRHRR